MTLDSELLIVAALLTANCSAQDFPIAKVGCKDKCGNIRIPFPLGLSDETYDTTKAFLAASDINFTNITLEGKLHVLQFISTDCYNESGPKTSIYPSFYLTKFFISNADNVLVAIGCNTEAVITGIPRDNREGFVVGRISKCYSRKFVYSRNFCSGIGCCQSYFPEGLKTNLFIAVKNYQNHTGIVDFNPCIVDFNPFIVEEKRFNFTVSDLKSLQDVDRMPMVAKEKDYSYIWLRMLGWLPRKSISS